MCNKSKFYKSFVILFGILIFQTAKAHDFLLENQKFEFEEPTTEELINPINLWATFYYIPTIEDGTGELPLRNIIGDELGPKLSIKDWCKTALEGSVKIKNQNGDYSVYNYQGNSETFPVDCKDQFPFDVSKSKFKISKSSFGEGLASYILAPYRSIATDPTIIPPGSAIYIPEARGRVIKLDNEHSITHDGYFFASDRGGAIKENHIDVFVGMHTNANFFPWVGHSSEKTFKAYIIKNTQITEELTKLHKK